jgi:SAM-dependent methyltransferase
VKVARGKPVDDATAERLIALNRAFYEVAGASFDRTRQTAWPGWRRLLMHLSARRPLRVLDAGCGNGRFARFLYSEGISAHYTGVDFSPALLAAAETALDNLSGVEATLIEADFVTNMATLPTGTFDLIVLFGVLHHVPGQERRAMLVRALVDRLAVGSVLAFTAWRFDRQPRFAGHAVPPPPGLALDPGDALLDWRAEGVEAVRYAHAVSDSELDALVGTRGLTLLDAYAADGQTGDLNEYRILVNRGT